MHSQSAYSSLLNMIDTFLEAAENLETLLRESADAEKALAEAMKPIEPLRTLALEKRNAVRAALDTMRPEIAGFENGKRQSNGDRKKKRGPRSMDAIISTASTRLLGEGKKSGRKKKDALEDAIERATKLAGSLTPEQKAQIEQKADQIWNARAAKA